ncbi:MAG: pyruvate formate lyase family protein, partial [Oscillospiraceae bacterium]|nr:pyruvate formate lyase family protein [Oscillospiraceae bacterium]
MLQWSAVSERIARLREEKDAFSQGKNISLNTERTRLFTDYYRAHGNEHPLLRRSGAIYEWASKREINIFDDDIFVGSPGPKKRMIATSVEWGVDWIPAIVDAETFKEAWQSGGNVHMSDEQRDELIDAYEFWKDNHIGKKLEGVLTEDVLGAFGNGSCIGSGGAMPPDAGGRGISTMSQGHYIGNFNKVINVGFGAVRREALAIIEEHKGKIFGDWAKRHLFYHGVVRICDAAILLAKRYGAACRAAAENAADAARRSELARMADSLGWIMENPARTYWEGLQAIILYQLILAADAQQHGQSTGRVDKYVGRLLEAQLADGSLTAEQAQEYTDAYVLKVTDIMSCHTFYLDNRHIIELNKKGGNLYSSIYEAAVPSGHNVITIGGSTPDGEDDSNAATYLLLQTIGRLRLPDPTVALRVHRNTPDDVWRLGIESSKQAGGIPQFENDEVIIPTLMRWGMTAADAANYSIVGCVEPSGTGCEWPACGNTGSDSVWNMMEVIQLIINGGVNPRTGVAALPCKKLYEYDSFEQLREAFVAEMKYLLDWTVSYASLYELAYSTHFPCVAASAMTDGCMESGKDVTEGGAKYNRTGLTACGTANVGDSLMAIKKLCFDDKTVSLREMYDALQNNWEGCEQLRQTIINDVPHYGNDDDEADGYAAWALGEFADIMSREYGPRGRYCGGTFTMTAHVIFGAIMGATPDGRRAG